MSRFRQHRQRGARSFDAKQRLSFVREKRIADLHRPNQTMPLRGHQSEREGAVHAARSQQSRRAFRSSCTVERLQVVATHHFFRRATHSSASSL